MTALILSFMLAAKPFNNLDGSGFESRANGVVLRAVKDKGMDHQAVGVWFQPDPLLRRGWNPCDVEIYRFDGRIAVQVFGTYVDIYDPMGDPW